MYVTRKTFAEFMFAPEENEPFGTLGYISYEVPPGDRDPLVPSHPGGHPSEAIGVRFYDVVAAEVPDPVTGSPIECRSTRMDLSPGMTFYRGTVMSQSVVTDKDLKAAMTNNSWDCIILVDDVMFPFRPGIDKV